MAGQGPNPKPAGARARRNKTSTAGRLRVITGAEAKRRTVPALPRLAGVKWHHRTQRWWRDLWSASDITDQLLVHERSGGLLMLAKLYNDFWDKGDLDAAAQVRLNEERMGLSPIARRRLQQEIDRGEQAEERTRTRRNQRKLQAAPDPRAAVRETG